ncbi:MAG: DNA replication and repair protein RecF [Candidatus Gracilibacteria bacterium]|nr:DNA replication and repair protein RecF [Candidatus Gracilibacteria bacterium]
MITSLKLKNFRNFENKELFFDDKKNFIVGENGKGKTNILESISLISLNSLVKIGFENLVKKGENIFYIEAILSDNTKIAISYDLEKNKKTYFINRKKTTKLKLAKYTIKSVVFSPLIMNMLYLSPSLRRDFLDDVLSSSFENYEKHLKNYKLILTNRNKLLKNIKEAKSDKSEIKFWDSKFIEACKIIYNYRFGLIDYIKENISESKEYFLGKSEKVEFVYKSKVSKENLETDIKSYLEKNLDRDIILGTTAIGPHIDDFDILIDSIPITEFASRGEVKSIILYLKLIEVKFIEKCSQKQPILLIDDLLSELDENHKNMLLKKLNGYQTIISVIKAKNTGEHNSVFLN